MLRAEDLRRMVGVSHRDHPADVYMDEVVAVELREGDESHDLRRCGNPKPSDRIPSTGPYPIDRPHRISTRPPVILIWTQASA